MHFLFYLTFLLVNEQLQKIVWSFGLHNENYSFFKLKSWLGLLFGKFCLKVTRQYLNFRHDLQN